MAGVSGQVPPQVDFLERRIRDLEASVRELQAARALELSNFKGGRLLWQDPSGGNRAVFGNVGLDGSIGGITAAYMFAVFGDGDVPVTGSPGAIVQMFREGDRGRTYPDRPFPLHPIENFAVTSATFTGLMEGGIFFPDMEVLFVEGAVITDASTTGQLRLRDTVAGTVTSTLTIPPDTNGRYSFTWLHPAPTGIYDPRTTLAPNLYVALDARRSGGAGSFVVYVPAFATLTSRFFRSTAASDGNPQLS